MRYGRHDHRSAGLAEAGYRDQKSLGPVSDAVSECAPSDVKSPLLHVFLHPGAHRGRNRLAAASFCSLSISPSANNLFRPLPLNHKFHTSSNPSAPFVTLRRGTARRRYRDGFRAASRIYTVTDESGRLLRRYRRAPDGREIIIIDNRYSGPPRAMCRGIGQWIDNFQLLDDRAGPPCVTMSGNAFSCFDRK